MCPCFALLKVSGQPQEPQERQPRELQAETERRQPREPQAERRPVLALGQAGLLEGPIDLAVSHEEGRPAGARGEQEGGAGARWLR